MITVGVLVRVSLEEFDATKQRLRALPSVLQTLELEEPGSLGLVLQGGGLDEVHAALTEQVSTVEGVLAAWPLHAELEGLAPTPTTATPDPNVI